MANSPQPYPNDSVQDNPVPAPYPDFTTLRDFTDESAVPQAPGGPVTGNTSGTQNR